MLYDRNKETTINWRIIPLLSTLVYSEDDEYGDSYGSIQTDRILPGFSHKHKLVPAE